MKSSFKHNMLRRDMKNYFRIIIPIFFMVIGLFLVRCKDSKDLSDVAPDLKATGVQDGKKTKMDVPAISCGAATQTSIEITVTAGATGAPAGFSLQWMTAADYEANGYQWYLSEDTRLCKASFSGNANLSRYNLAANGSATVSVGEFLFDNGASTNCDGALVCGTPYVFRAFAHANSSLNRSDFTPNLTCSTLACHHDEGCTFTQGYWKTHGPIPTGNNVNTWPVTSLTLGTVTYTDLQLQAILYPSRWKWFDRVSAPTYCG
jgi:hypothetical protein